VRRLSSFHDKCLKPILGVTRHNQRQQRITTRSLAEKFGMQLSITELVMEKRLWLGHVSCMDPERLPKKIIFGELQKKRPHHGTKRRWRDLVSSDLVELGVKQKCV